MNKRLLITIDFDGVVSPLPNNYNPPDGWVNVWDRKGESESFLWHDFTLGFRCFVREDVADFLWELVEWPDVELVWLTSWDESTTRFNDLTNGLIPEFPFLPIWAEERGGQRPSKVAALERKIREMRPTHVISIEDGQNTIRSYRKLLKNFEDVGFNAVKTESFIGLTFASMERVRKFLQAVFPAVRMDAGQPECRSVRYHLDSVEMAKIEKLKQILKRPESTPQEIVELALLSMIEHRQYRQGLSADYQ